MQSTMKVADRWFERRSLGDGITWLFEPHVNDFIRCNIWHVGGRDHDLLVDTGLGLASLRDEIADLAERPVIAVATHIHYDHVGSLHEFDDRRMHGLEAPRMTDYEEFQFLRLEDLPAAEAVALAASGYEIDADVLVDALPEAGFDLARYRVESARAQALEEADIIDLGDRHFEVMHLPGHSPGSIGLYETSSGTLFSGDAIYDGPLLDRLPDSDIADYIATMKRLRELPVTVVHAGHEPSFGRDRMVELADAYLVANDA
jgi:glyoxylase-like metal-dependent hydrolase (beta-lactamase superfamily II)